MFEYNICTKANEDIFKKQCRALEKNIPNLKKDVLLVDVDNSKTVIYLLNDKKITIHNSYYIGAVFIESEIDLEQFFN